MWEHTHHMTVIWYVADIAKASPRELSADYVKHPPLQATACIGGDGGLRAPMTHCVNATHHIRQLPASPADIYPELP